mmetsp:Transcript_49185/g.110600  ORF Transcript_49185/g.110600 Transcript_49185/m.110600 type:complete len:213 (-) Transcript_49185:824-1462(-)
MPCRSVAALACAQTIVGTQATVQPRSLSLSDPSSSSESLAAAASAAAMAAADYGRLLHPIQHSIRRRLRALASQLLTQAPLTVQALTRHLCRLEAHRGHALLALQRGSPLQVGESQLRVLQHKLVMEPEKLGAVIFVQRGVVLLEAGCACQLRLGPFRACRRPLHLLLRCDDGVLRACDELVLGGLCRCCRPRPLPRARRPRRCSRRRVFCW